MRGALALFVGAAFPFLVSGAQAAEPRIGINVVNPQWRPRAEQDATLDALKRAGVRLIRVPLLPPTGGTYEGAIDYVARAAARGIKVLLIVYPAFPPDVPARPLVPDEPEMWSLPPLSAADPEMLAATYGPVLRKLDAAGLELAGIEFGNEINWTAFNGEFPIPGRGVVLGFDDLREDAAGQRIAAGYRAYLRSLAALKRIRDGLVLNRRTPLIVGGLADFGRAGPNPGRKLDAVTVRATLRYLRLHGLDDLADAYSIHTYPELGQTAAQRAEALERDVLAECGVTGRRGKPCWLTEWGVADPGRACPPEDGPRLAVIRAFRDQVRPALQAGRVQGLIAYAWDGEGDPHAFVRCGALTASGRAALAPP